MWSLMKRLIWLHVISGGGGGGTVTTVTGTSPLTLANALAKSIRSLVQYGKVTTSDGDTYCNNGKLVAVDDELSVVGTPEVLTVGEQTATVANLFAVDDIKDEQNIISGTVTRRCEAVISDGTTPSGRYIGEVGDGNIIVKVRETGYEGDVATFEADSAKPLNGLTVNVEPIQAGTGDPSPDNVRPISGRTSATVTRTGRNLFDINTIRSTAHGMTVTIDGQTVKVDGTSSASGRATLAEFQFLKAGTYHLHTSGDLLWLKAWSSLGADATVTVDDISIVYRLATATLTSGTEYHLTATENQIEIGSSFSAYEPYAGNTYTIALGDTVYGGTLDVTAGKLTATMAMVDMGTVSWSKSSSQSAVSGSVFSAPVSSIGVGMAQRVRYEPNTAISNIYATAASSVWFVNTLPDFSLMVNANALFVADSRYNDAASFRAGVSGVQLCYELATPIEITLTPTQIETLIGTNNIWSDAGAVKAYVADGDEIEHVTAQPLRTAEGSNTVSVTSAVAPVQLSATYTASE